ncbi:MAG TPA: TonB-dependent receptor [Terriglobia bacterium]|nr:TonB-dependent receptor [Terriglobia bacterium]
MGRLWSYALAGILLGLSMVVFCIMGQAQVVTGSITGQVLDPSHAAVPGATVTATNVESGARKTTTTGSSGNYTIPFVAPGNYTVTVSARGFKTLTREGIQVSVGQPVSLNLGLEVGTTTQTVSVTAAAPLLNSVNAQQNFSLNTMKVDQLPVNQRDIVGLLNLGTGVSTQGEGEISMNGLPSEGFSFTIDGVNSTPDSERSAISLYQGFNVIKGTSMQAIQEVQVAKNIYSADIGNALSGNVNIITKSGTNTFHGDAFENYQSGGLRAVNHFVAEKAPQVFHQFGGAVGGPIVKNKLFFFGDYEGYRQTGTVPESGSVPSRYIRNVVGAAIPSSVTYWEIWPLPTGSEQPGDVSAFFGGVADSTETTDQYDAKIDWDINPTNIWSVRFSRGRPTYLQPRLAIGNSRDRVGKTDNISSIYTHVWSPTLSSQFLFGYNYSFVNRIDLQFAHQDIPAISLPGLPSTEGDSELFVKFGSNTNWKSQNVWVHGRHTVKFGGSWQINTAHRQNEETPGYDFATLNELLNNQPSAARYGFALPIFRLSQNLFGGYVQDDFRIKPRFMLNLGFRYDYGQVPQEIDGHFFNRDGPFGPFRDPDSAWNADYTNFSPRIGFAWTVDQAQKTVVRGGVGIFYIPQNMFAGPVDLVAFDPFAPNGATLTGDQLQALGVRYPDGNDVVQPLVASTGIISINAIDPNFKNAYAEQWSLQVERQLSSNTVVDVGYMGNHGVHIPMSPLVNRPSRTTGLPPFSNFGQFNYYQSADMSNYNSLQLSLRKRFSNSLMFDTYYTYSDDTTFWADDMSCCGEENGPQELNDLASNHGPASVMQRHVLTGDLIYHLPFGETMFGTSNSVAKAIIGGWQVAGTWNFHSGTPLLIGQGGTNSPGARPDLLATSPNSTIRDGYRTPLPNGDIMYLDTSMFAQVPLGPGDTTIRPGTLSRNGVFGPEGWTMDSSLFKNFQIKERATLQLRLDVFNLWNRTNYDNPETDVSSSDFGRITSSEQGRVLQLSGTINF